MGGTATDGRDIHQPLLDNAEDPEQSKPGDQTPRRVNLDYQKPFGSRWVTFALVHYLPFLAQLSLIWIAYTEGQLLILFCTLGAVGFSGVFYCYVAWFTTAPGLFVQGCLPLKNQPLILGLVMLLPYGCLQWVIVNLHLKDSKPPEYSSLTSACSASPSTSKAPSRLQGRGEARGQGRVRAIVRQRPCDTGRVTTRRRHRLLSYKAVDAIVESIIISAAILYTHWTKRSEFGDDIKGLVISLLHGDAQRAITVLSECLILASGGAGLMHVDYCCSETVRDRMRSSPYWVCAQILFRTCEVASRLSILTGFAVMATIHSSWWWMLIVAEVAVSAYLVLLHGGLRNTKWAIGICILSTTIVNVFCFMDSPSRYGCARKISYCLTCKYLVELILAGIFMMSVMDLRSDFGLHGPTLTAAMVATAAYWVLWYLLCFPWKGEYKPEENIFSACRENKIELVKSLISPDGPMVMDLDKLDIQGMTPLMHAADCGHNRVCVELLQGGAARFAKSCGEVNWLSHLWGLVWQPAGRQWTAVHFAAWRGHLKVLRVFLHNIDKEECLSLTDANGNTPLHVAVDCGNHDAVKLILRYGPPEWRSLRNSVGDVPNLDPYDDDEAVGTFSESPPRLLHAESSAALDQLVVPITSSECLQQKVPLGLSSSLVCASSGQAGPAFVPKSLAITGAAEGRRTVLCGLHFEELTPCSIDAQWRPIPIADLKLESPKTWKHPDVALGNGQYGTVWRACDKSGNLFAVKCLTKETREHECVALREAQVALAVRGNPHPCLVKVFLYHQLEEYICVVTELCAGGTLQALLKQHSQHLMRNGKGIAPMYKPPTQTYQWLSEVFLGLHYVHSKMDGIVRDLKPENVGLACGASTHAQLLDYGSYRLTGPSLGHRTFGCNPAGTAGYASPEILRGSRYNLMADFYSFGVMAWVMFTGGLQKSVLPPCTWPCRNVKELANDYQLLRHFVEQAGAYRVRELTDGERELVLKLTDPKPSKRGTHSWIRASLEKLLQRSLPAPEAEPQQVEAWLQGPSQSSPSEVELPSF